MKGRKLRHLTGIALRNLSTQNVPSRPHEKSTDDDCLAATWKSPSKVISTHPEIQGGEAGSVEGDSSATEAAGLVHSKSSNNLPVGGFEGSPRPRRRSARGNSVRMESPIPRRKRLGDVAAGRMADTFFTLHVLEFGGGRYPVSFCSYGIVFVEEETLS